ncbi:hypothetical protein CKAH01_06166 [Colletotrichum kahawae]|uniref:Uncharacterized protein n=1 Tax=Colletotrichum kahawae TaxID=34407 RepID=A0AAE0D642_COLKA|nr:hypothetical protein CKAH01_06166 [Colletotrichum kahawae]
MSSLCFVTPGSRMLSSLWRCAVRPRPHPLQSIPDTMDTESPSVVCICQDHEEEAVAAAILGSDEEGLPITETSTTRSSDRRTAKILILDPSNDVFNMHGLRYNLANLSSTEVILVTTILAQPLPNTHPTDLFLSQDFGNDTIALSPLQYALSVLHAEVGDFGGWLPHHHSGPSSSPLEESPKLHYDITLDSLLAVPASTSAALQILQTQQLRTAVCVFAVQTHDACVTQRSFQSAALLAKELRQLAVDLDSWCLTIESLSDTEHIVPARPTPQPKPLPCYQFPTYGKNVLLVIPTENTKKKEVFEKYITRTAPDGTQIHTITFPIESGVGEQPYNIAGSDGARNRVKNALVRLQSSHYAEMFAKESIGSIIVASIENYIQTEDIDRPADFAIAIIHNATTNQTRSSSSRGVTIAPRYVDRARRFGTNGDTNFGNVTVGKVMAARVPQLDHADWHRVVAGLSRYDLLAEAVANIQTPW